MQSCTFSGEVINVWGSSPDTGKKPLARATLKWREFQGSNPDGSARYRDAQVVLIGWDKKAQSLAKLKPGDRVVAEGRCQVGEPYQSKKNEKWYASLECHINNFELMFTTPRGEETADQSPAAAPAVVVAAAADSDDGSETFAF